ALFWKMQAGMGDVVFAPFYEVLRRRGVSFQFFHRLTDVKLSEPGAGSPHITGLDFDVQAEIAGGGEYQPLVDIRGLPCWPSQPRYDQLVDGQALAAAERDFECHWERHRAATKSLRVSEDFDFVVLAIGVGAIPHTCADLGARDPRWRAMVHNVRTVATQAFQIWLDADARQLGWDEPPVNLSAFVKPFDTWADMSHLAPSETWPRTPRSIAYFCSVLPEPETPAEAAGEKAAGRPSSTPGEVSDDPDFPARQAERVRAGALGYLARDVRQLWPRAVRADGGFRWELLSQPEPEAPPCEGAAGPERFDSQYWKANVSPSDRYVLSLPGTLKYRISPLDMSYDNLTVAGDWTECGLNTGCVESAVMSGRLAAHALSHYPPLEDIVGYDHP
ncbi:MAG: FAD-dependent oxidoreductase, partial [Myxococcota bacterium]